MLRVAACMVVAFSLGGCSGTPSATSADTPTSPSTSTSHSTDGITDHASTSPGTGTGTTSATGAPTTQAATTSTGPTMRSEHFVWTTVANETGCQEADLQLPVPASSLQPLVPAPYAVASSNGIGTLDLHAWACTAGRVEERLVSATSTIAFDADLGTHAWAVLAVAIQPRHVDGLADPGAAFYPVQAYCDEPRLEGALFLGGLPAQGGSITFGGPGSPLLTVVGDDGQRLEAQGATVGVPATSAGTFGYLSNRTGTEREAQVLDIGPGALAPAALSLSGTPADAAAPGGELAGTATLRGSKSPLTLFWPPQQINTVELG